MTNSKWQSNPPGSLRTMSGLDDYFKGAPKTVAPWPRAGKRKGEHYLSEAAASRLLSASPRLREFDPASLHATQPWVLASHTRYYLTGEWELTGRTSADMDQRLNRYPLILDRNGKLIILTGHHRSLAALIEGRAVLARLVDDDDAGAIAVTPHLWVDRSRGSATSIEVSTAHMRAGRLVEVGSLDEATSILHSIGLTSDEIADRLRVANLEERRR